MTLLKQRDIHCDASLEGRDNSATPHQNTEIESTVKTSTDPASSDSILLEISSKLSSLSMTLACAVDEINLLKGIMDSSFQRGMISTLDSGQASVQSSKTLFSSSTASSSVLYHCNGRNSDLKLADQPSGITTSKGSSSKTDLRLADKPSDGVASLSDITTEKYGSSPHLGLTDPLSGKVLSLSDIKTEKTGSGVADPTSERFALVSAANTAKPDPLLSAVAIASRNPFPSNDSSLPSNSEAVSKISDAVSQKENIPPRPDLSHSSTLKNSTMNGRKEGIKKENSCVHGSSGKPTTKLLPSNALSVLSPQIVCSAEGKIAVHL